MFAGLLRSMPNAINADQNPGIDPTDAMNLIGIDRHWALIAGVLCLPEYGNIV